MIDLFNRAAGLDFDDAREIGDPQKRYRKLVITVAAVAFSMLMLEVLLARMYAFFLGNISAFVAIPIAMFGLSLGALALHWSPGVSRPRWIPLLLPILFAMTLVAFAAMFWLFNEVFNLTHYAKQNPRSDALKTISLSLVFVPVFAVAGVVLSSAFRAGADRIGRLYALDLAGSALACLVTPLALHTFDLPLVICLVLLALGLANLAIFSACRPAVGVGLIVLMGLLGVAGHSGRIFTERPDPDVLGVRYKQGRDVKELRHRWNEVSRVALVEWSGPGKPTEYRVLHDDGVSNVRVRAYVPARVARPPRPASSQSFPMLMDRKPETALVIFAGAGQDMIQMYEYAGGELSITGVEINGLVPWAVTTPPHDQWNLRPFYDLPEIDLVIDEGRAFLNRDRNRYDVIFAASNGAQQAVRSGHVRKFLDTYEAVEAYLDHLNDDGLIIFNVQPYRYKLDILKRLLVERGRASLAEATMIVGKGRWSAGNRVDTLLIKPSGFSPEEILRVRQVQEGTMGRNVHYAPGFAPIPELAEYILSPVAPDAFVPHDDQPYEERVDLSEFELFPDPGRFSKLKYSLSWIKIFTMVFFGSLSLLAVVAFYLKRRGGRRLPLDLLAYFMVTGICYMLVQIGLMAKLELFMGKPIYAIAVVLAAFLLANGAGSAWIGLRQSAGTTPSPLLPAIAAAVIVPLTLLAVDGGLLQFLGLPVALKAILALITVVPLAFVLGMFYPLGVGLTTSRGLGELVPMTFGLATLSSVVGSNYAMVAVINQGFRRVILQAELGYLLLVVVLLALVGVARKQHLAAH